LRDLLDRGWLKLVRIETEVLTNFRFWGVQFPWVSSLTMHGRNIRALERSENNIAVCSPPWLDSPVWIQAPLSNPPFVNCVQPVFQRGEIAPTTLNPLNQWIIGPISMISSVCVPHVCWSKQQFPWPTMMASQNYPIKPH
jgi:hypothetical protein